MQVRWYAVRMRMTELRVRRRRTYFDIALRKKKKKKKLTLSSLSPHLYAFCVCTHLTTVLRPAFTVCINHTQPLHSLTHTTIPYLFLVCSHTFSVRFCMPYVSVALCSSRVDKEKSTNQTSGAAAFTRMRPPVILHTKWLRCCEFFFFRFHSHIHFGSTNW